MNWFQKHIQVCRKIKEQHKSEAHYFFHHHVTVVILREGGQSFCLQLQHNPTLMLQEIIDVLKDTGHLSNGWGSYKILFIAHE